MQIHSPGLEIQSFIQVRKKYTSKLIHRPQDVHSQTRLCTTTETPFVGAQKRFPVYTLRGTSLREGNVCGDWEEGLVVDLALYPVHQQGDVVGGGQVGRLLVLGSVLA